jgi:hypothetical protein
VIPLGLKADRHRSKGSERCVMMMIDDDELIRQDPGKGSVKKFAVDCARCARSLSNIAVQPRHQFQVR